MKKANHIRIEDFSVYMDEIPIKKEMYKNDTNLLSAILIPYLEEEIAQELIGQGFPPEQAKEQSQIVQIQYGIKSFRIMEHVVKIIEDSK